MIPLGGPCHGASRLAARASSTQALVHSEPLEAQWISFLWSRVSEASLDLSNGRPL